jgi:hypothetical protein
MSLPSLYSNPASFAREGIFTFHLQPFDSGVITASVRSWTFANRGFKLTEFSNRMTLWIGQINQWISFGRNRNDGDEDYLFNERIANSLSVGFHNSAHLLQGLQWVVNDTQRKSVDYRIKL